MGLVETRREELRLARGPVTRALVALGVGLAVGLPLLGPVGMVRCTMIAIIAIGVLGQNLIVGYTGQISFGQAGFLAIGAYAFAHLELAGVPWILALCGAGLAAALAGAVVGFPSLRPKGPYLALAPLGLGIPVYHLPAT